MFPKLYETRTKTSIRYAREEVREKRDREGEINKIEIDTYLFVK